MLLAILEIIIGFIILSWAADKFIDASVSLASYLGLSALFVGLTIVAFGTSLPELFVAMMAAINGKTDIAIGNAIGSNIANIGLVLGLVALLVPLKFRSRILWREFPLLLMVMGFVYILMFKQYLGIWDGILLLVLFSIVIYIIYILGEKTPQLETLSREYQEEVKETQFPLKKSIIYMIVCLLLLPLSSQLIVHGAVKLATLLGVSQLFIGLSMVAFGTSLPEIATSISAARKNEHDMVIGNIIGSNLFNILPVIALTCLIHPTKIAPIILQRDMLYMFIITIVLFVIAFGRKQGRIQRWKGIILIGLYVGYLALISMKL